MCWTWLGPRDRDGYGRLKIEGKQVAAHRLALELSGIAVPRGAVVMHTCDNPGCVRPEHLRAGSQKENMQDASRKRRVGVYTQPLAYPRIRARLARTSEAS